MNLSKLFKKRPLKVIRISKENIANWNKFSQMLDSGNVKFDKEGRLRYSHGAPVGDMILVKVNKDGTCKYKESTKEWFDPESKKAKNFIWP